MGNKQHNILLIASIALYSASFVPGLSFLLLLFLAPLIVILDNIERKVSLKWLVGFYLTILIGSLSGAAINGQSFNFGIFAYPLGLTLIMAIGIYISGILKGSIKSTALMGFWLGYNYLILTIIPNWSIYFVFNNLYDDSFLWTAQTGFLGIAFWGLISNVILSKQIANTSDKLIENPLLLTILALVITTPMWISSVIGLTNEPISQSDMFLLYSQSDATAIYAARGEWIARTCAWLAVLLCIYGLVKRKTAK